MLSVICFFFDENMTCLLHATRAREGEVPRLAGAEDALSKREQPVVSKHFDSKLVVERATCRGAPVVSLSSPQRARWFATPAHGDHKVVCRPQVGVT